MRWRPIEGLPFVAAADAVALPDADIAPYLTLAIEEATHSVRAASFIINPDGSDDPIAPVRILLDALVDATWRGLDVRVICGLADDGSSIDIGNEIAERYLRERGVSVRRLKPRFNATVHSKYTVVDRDEVILGSHNWSPNAFTKSTEDSIACRSGHLGQIIAHQFDRLWSSGVVESDAG